MRSRKVKSQLWTRPKRRPTDMIQCGGCWERVQFRCMKVAGGMHLCPECREMYRDIVGR